MPQTSGNRLVEFLGSARGIFAGIAAGAVLGWGLGPAAEHLRPIGTVFISLLKLVVIPLVFASIVAGIYRTGNAARLGSLGMRTVFYYLATTSLAIVTGLALVNAVKPGAGLVLESSGYQPEVSPAQSLADFLERLVPSNIFAAFSEMNILGIILFAAALGAALLFSGDEGKPLATLIAALEHAFMSLTRGIICLAPIGVIGLVAPLVGTFGFETLVSFGRFAATVLAGLLIHAFIILPLVFRIFSGRSIWGYFLGVRKALLAAFATASSSATLPISMECARENKIKEETSGFVLPLGATINMDGTALYEAVVAMFIAQSLNVEMTAMQQITIFLTATLASIGAAGIPSAGLVTLLLVLQSVGLPAVGLGVLFAIDRPLDMCRTTVNVWGDLVGCAVVEGRENA